MERPLTIRGVIPSIVTPFDSNLEVDEKQLRRYAKHVAEIPGVTALLCAAYTGEVDSLTRDEKLRIIEICREEVSEEVKIFACVDAHSTLEAIDLGRALKAAGAQAIQVNSPFLNPHRRGYLATHDASVQFFRAISDKVDLPMTVFQYPESSGLCYSADTLIELAKIRNVVGIKQAGGIDNYIASYLVIPRDVAFIADNNGYTLLSMLLWGADATMVGASNVGTALYCELFESVKKGDLACAVDLMNGKIVHLTNIFTRNLGHSTASFITRMKAALVTLGLIDSALVRPPEPEITESERKQIKQILQQVGLV